jgi:hypothetical protein
LKLSNPKVAIAAGLITTALMACGIGVATTARADDDATIPAVEAPLDPVTEALGADTPEAVVELQQAQQELTQIGLSGSPEGDHANQVRSDLGDAVDELYAAVTDDPVAQHAQASWRHCMAELGTPYDSPAAIEVSIDAPRVDPDHIDGHLLDDVLANRDACDAQVQDDLATALEDEFPAWADEHGVTIEQYRDLVDSVSD